MGPHPPEKPPIQDFFCLICLQCPAATEDNEPFLVAQLLTIAYKEPYILPLLTEDQSLQLCTKTLVSLALFFQALEKRTQNHGAPSPQTYRKAAQTELCKVDRNSYVALAEHHQEWEAFLSEQLI